ncbi:GAF domain-containing protein, partial [Georgenia sp. 10Sc9-8]|nr:GAF domain-containing protein [Georgenia halotolerans]
MDRTLMAPDEPVDLDNCAREPIHVPGSVQPRGALLVVDEAAMVVVQTSDNVADLLGRPVEEVLGARLGAVLGAQAETAVVNHARAEGDVRDRNPLSVTVPVEGAPVVLDALVHRPPVGEAREPEQLLVVELERVAGTRPLTYAGTYRSVRGAVGALNRSSSLAELYDVTAYEVRRLTGFDRVMVYRFDADHNGEVVAEARREDLNPFLGLHYPATDIPSQARALYEKNWIRLISDVGYTPVPLVPTLNPRTGAPLDLTHATLRSVSPIHIEYLQNMGVTASMSISLLQDGRLWGLIACHHYTGPYGPPYEVRAAAEFLGSVLSLRLVAQVEEERIAAARRVGRDLAGLVGASRDEHIPLAQALTADRTLLEIMDADGAVVRAQGETVTLGTAPAGAQADAVLAWAARSGEDLACTTSVAQDAPELTDVV